VTFIRSVCLNSLCVRTKILQTLSAILLVYFTANGRSVGSSPIRLGPAAQFAWEEYFAAHIRNPHTRAAYGLAVRRFLTWCESGGLELRQVTPGHLGAYFNEHPGSIPTKKQHLAAVRGLFDALVLRHAAVLNPAASVRLERYQVIEGKTPEITVAQARTLLASIDTSHVVGLRDRAAISLLIYTAARAGAVAKLRMGDFEHDGNQFVLWFSEKGGKSRVEMGA
jgi:integrase/recombinase XerD